jgi:hypothetical protein
MVDAGPHALQINASPDGKHIIFSGPDADNEAANFAFEASNLPVIIDRLLRIVAQPDVSRHLPPLPEIRPGTIEEVRPYPVAAMSVTKVFLVEQVGLILDLVGAVRLNFQFSQDAGATLSQQLRDAVEQLRGTSLGQRQ